MTLKTYLLAAVLFFIPLYAVCASTVNLPQSGQASCWDPSGATSNTESCTGSGQDGDFRAGSPWPSPRFTNNNDGTMTDNLTGLIWTTNADPAGTLSFQAALAYVANMNTGGGTYGYTDWRLPNETELRSLLDYSQSMPSVPVVNPFSGSVALSYYLTSSTFAYSPPAMWDIVMDEAYMVAYVKPTAYYVWPVRGGLVGGLATLSISFSGTGTGTVTSTPVTLSDPTIVCTNTSGAPAGTCTAQYNQSITTTLAAVPNPGSTFTGWSGGGCTGTGTCTLSASIGVSITAAFTGPPVISLSPASYNFGNVLIGGPASHTFTVSNTGWAPLNISSIVVTDSDNTTPSTMGYSFANGSPSCTSPIAPGAQCNTVVTLNPATTGVLSGILKISSNDRVKPVITASLTGTGAASYAQHFSITDNSTCIGTVSVYSTDVPPQLLHTITDTSGGNFVVPASPPALLDFYFVPGSGCKVTQIIVDGGNPYTQPVNVIRAYIVQSYTVNVTFGPSP